MKNDGWAFHKHGSEVLWLSGLKPTVAREPGAHTEHTHDSLTWTHFVWEKKKGRYWIMRKSKASTQNASQVERLGPDSLHNDSTLERENLSSQHTIWKATIWVIELPARQVQVLWVEETSESLVWGCSLVYRFHSFKAHVLLLIWHVSWGAGDTIQRHYKLGTCRFIWLYKISARQIENTIELGKQTQNAEPPTVLFSRTIAPLLGGGLFSRKKPNTQTR